MTKILETLSVVQAEGRIPLAEIITAEGAHLRRNATAVIVTSTDHSHWITAAGDISQRGVKVVTVLIDPRTFGNPRSNEGLVGELAASGILTYMIRRGDDLAEALAHPYAEAITPVRHLV